jgi:hypothetical protein
MKQCSENRILLNAVVIFGLEWFLMISDFRVHPNYTGVPFFIPDVFDIGLWISFFA